jgi:hypothetical protein
MANVTQYGLLYDKPTSPFVIKHTWKMQQALLNAVNPTWQLNA